MGRSPSRSIHGGCGGLAAKLDGAGGGILGGCSGTSERIQGVERPIIYGREERVMRGLIVATTVGLLSAGLAEACDDHRGVCEIEDWRWYSTAGSFLMLEGVATCDTGTFESGFTKGKAISRSSSVPLRDWSMGTCLTRSARTSRNRNRSQSSTASSRADLPPPGARAFAATLLRRSLSSAKQYTPADMRPPG